MIFMNNPMYLRQQFWEENTLGFVVKINIKHFSCVNLEKWAPVFQAQF